MGILSTLFFRFEFFFVGEREGNMSIPSWRLLLIDPWYTGNFETGRCSCVLGMFYFKDKTSMNLLPYTANLKNQRHNTTQTDCKCLKELLYQCQIISKGGSDTRFVGFYMCVPSLCLVSLQILQQTPQTNTRTYVRAGTVFLSASCWVSCLITPQACQAISLARTAGCATLMPNCIGLYYEFLLLLKYIL